MIQCLSCHTSVRENEIAIKYEVLVCKACQERVEAFLRIFMADLRMIDSLSGNALRKALLAGEFKKSWDLAEPLDRFALLIRFMQEPKQCHSSSTPPLSQLSQSSGEPLPPHVSTLTALAAAGRKGSNSPTE